MTVSPGVTEAQGLYSSKTKLLISIWLIGDREMAPWLRAQTAPTEDPGSVPSIHMMALNHLVPSIQHLPTSVGTGIHIVHTYSCRQNTHTHEIKTSLNFKINKNL